MRRHAEVMGTVASFDVRDGIGEKVFIGVTDAALAELERLEAMFSTFRPGSELSRINRGELAVEEGSPEVRDVLAACAWLERESEGVFSLSPPGLPGNLDLAGYVKGWAVDRSARVLRDTGLADWCLNVGGDLMTAGRPEADRCWSIAIRHPADREQVALVIAAPDRAVATSGSYERGEHVWDGRSGRRVASCGSLTVTGPLLAWADAFATIGFALGADRGLDFVGRYPGYEACWISGDGDVLATPGFDALITG